MKGGGAGNEFTFIGRKGVLFTLLAFILLLSVLSLHQLTEKRKNALESTVIESNAFGRVSDKYANIRNNFTVLGASEAERLVDERILPFNYSIDGKRFSISTTLPARQSQVNNFLETMNAFRVFIEDENYSNEFDSMRADLNTLLPTTWGGTDTNISFLVEPQCLKYSILDKNVQRLEFICEGYDYSAVKSQDVNIFLGVVHDFNFTVSCNFNNEPASDCSDSNNLNNAFDPASTLPYLSIEIFDENCGSCTLNTATIRGHFDPAQESSVKMRCISPGCTMPDLDLNFAGATILEYGGELMSVSIAVDLNSAIEEFSFSDANISVENSYFGARVWG